MQKFQICLWFDNEAEAAVQFYTTVFKDASIGRTAHYTSEHAQAVHDKPAGSVLSIEFQLNGQDFIALNAGPHFKFNESISFIINCADQAEVDYYWERLGAGGDPAAQQCGWLKDKFGVSWQVVPLALGALMSNPDPSKVGRVTSALMEMKKLDLAALERAALPARPGA